MNRWQGKVAVVTGASAGIGLATSKALLREGLIVVGLARRKDKMETEMQNVETKGKFYAYKCDVTSESEVTEAFDWIKKNVGVVQILVNNAGIVSLGKIHDTSRKEWEKVFNVNVMGILECSKHAINMMKEADIEGHIVNINSTLGHCVPYFRESSHCNVYAGSKHAVTALTQSLQNEVMGGKIRVTSVSPGLVKTEILQANNIEVDISKWSSLESEDVADAILYILGSPHRDIMNDIEGNGKFCARKCDVSDEAQVIEAFQWIKENLGVVPITVNNAGLTKTCTPYDSPNLYEEEAKFLLYINAPADVCSL